MLSCWNSENSLALWLVLKLMAESEGCLLKPYRFLEGYWCLGTNGRCIKMKISERGDILIRSFVTSMKYRFNWDFQSKIWKYYKLSDTTSKKVQWNERERRTSLDKVLPCRISSWNQPSHFVSNPHLRSHNNINIIKHYFHVIWW